MIKVKLNKRFIANRLPDTDKASKSQYLMVGTECYMDANRANYLAGLGEVVILKAAKKPAKKVVEEDVETDTDKPDL